MIYVLIFCFKGTLEAIAATADSQTLVPPYLQNCLNCLKADGVFFLVNKGAGSCK